MFENLTNKFSNIVNSVFNKKKLNNKNIKDNLKKIKINK